MGPRSSSGRRQRVSARAVAEFRLTDPAGHTKAARTSLAFLTRRWRADIEERNADRRVFRLPTPRSRPGIRPQLRGVSKEIAARYFQLLSGHARMRPSSRRSISGRTVTYVGGATREGGAGSTSSKSAPHGQARSGNYGKRWARNQENEQKAEKAPTRVARTSASR